ncbi:class I SAM-dependent methyltransferase [Streptomyces sp. RPT161]|uniref:class I SAM-dependent methyltransferase n=1 Tax=Streptomyces sp. RPT161 TaxID=3015993 RepID=UPI0022B90AEB|nr:class I SAM-dependent methyltransferase [Streptomyces sp. RPT161]
MPSLLPPEQQGRLLRACFEHKHRRPDPWGHAVDPYEAFKYAQTLACVPRRQYRRIVDIGCSEGTFTYLVAEAHPAADVLGVDISERALTRARSRATAAGREITFEALDVLTHSPRHRFDLAFCCELLYYLGRNDRLSLGCARIAALLAPGGMLVLVHPWPESRGLYRSFDDNTALILHSEQVWTTSHRPFAVTVYERT